ncbi:PREDICTED: leukemia inhibitory factor-like [Chrysochloris asiatica]|uniref:Leukemia inhibitory factor n=1 Tax=Chrysochloris asiatica TaxID=185453 RepID=A0A9B0TSG5_CHRAS|nr:PREDICTED: leukemia inhibitory factor-like [Chrysochloris asiatica]
MVPLSWLPGILSLLLALNLKYGAGNPISVGEDDAPCTTAYPCPSNVMSQVKNQLMLLHNNADHLLKLYYTAQGEPFQSSADKLCSWYPPTFPPFYPNGIEKDKVMQLYHIIMYLDAAVGQIIQKQKILNPTEQDLHNQLSSTLDILRGTISNVLCHLCNTYKVGKVEVSTCIDVLDDNFLTKQQGCQLLVKYKTVMAELVQAF